MSPTSIIFAAAFALLLFPTDNSKLLSSREGKEFGSVSGQRVDLHLFSAGGNNKGPQAVEQKVQATKSLEAGPEHFTELPLEMESWMEHPENWNNNKD